MTTMQIKDATGVPQTVEKPLTPGRAGASVSRPVVLSTEDSTAIAAIATQATQAAVLAALQTAPPVTIATALIANAGSLSGSIDCTAGRLARIDMPNTWSTAALTFQVSEDGTQFFDLHKSDGTEYSIPVAANQAFLLPLIDFRSVRYLKVRSGPSATPVAQGGARSINLILVA
jgi:hypothetical protein